MPRIDFAVACQRCAAQLSRMDSAGVCLTCGRPIAETVDDRILDLTTGAVAVDLTCAECSYNLRTLRFDATCPECGTPVQRSLGVEELRFCDPQWLGRVRRGISIVLISLLAVIVLGMLGGIAAVLVGFRSVPTTSVLLLFLLPSMIGYALVIIGTLNITTPKPDEPKSERTNLTCRITRVLLLVSFILYVVSMVIAVPFATLTGGSISLLSFSLGVAQSLLYGSATIGTLIVLARIAVLGRRRGLRKLSRVLALLVGFQILGQIAVSVYTFFACPTIAVNLSTWPFASTTTSTTYGAGGIPVVTSVKISTSVMISRNQSGGYTHGTNTTGSAGSNSPTALPAALAPGTGTMPTTPAPLMVPFAVLAMFACFSGIVIIGTFVLGLIVLVKYRNLLSSAIAASVTSVQRQPPLQNGPVA